MRENTLVVFPKALINSLTLEYYLYLATSSYAAISQLPAAQVEIGESSWVRWMSQTQTSRYKHVFVD